MTGLKRKPSELPGDQPPPKLLKQTTSTTINTAFEKDSDIDNIPPPILEKADTYIEKRPRAVPYGGQSNDNGSNSSTPPPILPRFPTLKPTRTVKTPDKYFGFEMPSDDEEEDDSITRLAESICADDSTSNIVESERTVNCIGTNTNYDSNGTNEKSKVSMLRADTIALSDSNGSNGEGKKSKLSKKGTMKKVLSPKKSAQLKKNSGIKKEKSILLDSLESLRTIQTLPSGTIIEKIMKFGAEEIIDIPSNRSFAVYEFNEIDTATSSQNLSSIFQRPSFQVISETLKSVENEAAALPRLECVSSEELSGSDSEANTAPTLPKVSITSPTKSPKKFIHGGIREIVFSFDTTGSMYSYMEEAKDQMRELVERLKIDIPGVRLAFIAHGDYYDLKHDRYLIKWLDFGASLDEICNFFEYLPITHGGDADECYELVLRKVRDSLSWTTGSQRCLVMIGDSDPHEPGYQFEDFVNDIDWKEETKKLCEMGVRIYGMQVGYRSDFYRQISQTTGGAHLRLDSANLTSDMLMAVCLREGNLKLLKTYEAEVMKRPDYKGGLDLELARLFSSLKNVPDNIAMKFKKNLAEGTTDKENMKKLKGIKRTLVQTGVSPGSKIAKLAKKALSEDEKKNKKSKKLSPEKEKKLKKLSVSDKIAKSLVKKAIKGTKEKKKTPTKEKKKTLSKDKKKTPLKDKKKTSLKKKTPSKKDKTVGSTGKKKVLVKSDKKKPRKDSKKETKSRAGGLKSKTVLGSKVKKNITKGKQTAAKIKAKSVIKAILKSKNSAATGKTQLKGKLKSPVKVKKTSIKLTGKNKTVIKTAKLKAGTKPKTVTKVKPKGVPVKKLTKLKTKAKIVDKKKTSNNLPQKKKEISKPKVEKKLAPKKPPEKKTASNAGKTKNQEIKKKTPGKQPTTTKKIETKKSTDTKQTKTKKPKDLQPREIASIAKFVTGPLSCLSWDPWCSLIAHEKPKSGNWSKGKAGCPGFCNSDYEKTKSSGPVLYEFAVSPPDSSKKYPVGFHSCSDNLWEFHKNKHIQNELERIVKLKGSISVRKGTLNKNDDVLYARTVENIKNMFDYAWISNSSKVTARKDDLVKEGFVIAKV